MSTWWPAGGRLGVSGGGCSAWSGVCVCVFSRVRRGSAREEAEASRSSWRPRVNRRAGQGEGLERVCVEATPSGSRATEGRESRKQGPWGHRVDRSIPGGLKDAEAELLELLGTDAQDCDT